MTIDADLIALVAGLVAAAISVYVYWRSGRIITLEGVQETVTATGSLAEELKEVGMMAVTAAAQLKETGKITTNEAAFAHAFDHLQRWFPALDRQVLTNAVEGSYHMYKLMRAVTGGKAGATREPR